MAFIKRGDDMPIEGYINKDGGEETCDKCGLNLTVIAINEDSNKLVCEDCDIELEQYIQ